MRSDRNAGLRTRGPGIALAAAAALVSGCITATRYETNTPRSATEQLLVSEAIEGAVSRIELPAVADRRVAVDVESPADGDRDYLRRALEARLRAAGARVVPADRADLLVVALAGALGTVSRSTEIGIPSLPVPFAPGLLLPGLPLFKFDRHRGYAKLRLVAHDPAGAHVAATGPVLDRTRFDAYRILFLVLRRDDIYREEVDPAEGE